MSFGTVAAAYLTVMSHVEHTVYSATAPDIVLSDDGMPITLATSFYRLGAQTDGWRVIGGRLYVPAGAVASLPATATVFWFHDSFGAQAVLSTRTYEESKVINLAAGWNDFYWNAPYAPAAAPAERVWIGYTFGNTKYLKLDGVVPYIINASDGSSIKFADNPEGGIGRGAYYFSSGADSESSNTYGLDIIFDEGV